MIRTKVHTSAALSALLAVALFLLPVAGLAQTKISYHSNKFKPTDDVKLGRQAAHEVEQQLPLLRDREAGDYVSRVGQRLVQSIPPEFQHPEFQYYFKVVNARDINAFALPGGPMYVNRGMIEAARNEGEMAGVMAHELSHVALRHGTAQATKAQKYSLLAGILGVGGAVVGGPLGTVAQLGAQGVGVYFLKFSREYETEADVLGAQIMSRAGYDPRDLANMFRTIEQTSGGGGGFLSDHPSPKDRYERINREAQYLQVSNRIRDSREFDRVRAKLRSMPRAPSMQEIQQSGQRYPVEGDSNRYPDEGDQNQNDSIGDVRPTGRVAQPSSRYNSYSVSGIMRVSVPSNWRQLTESNNSVWFSPEGGYGRVNGQVIYTHGINFSVIPAQGRNLQSTFDAVLRDLTQNNPDLRRTSTATTTRVNGRYWMSTQLSNTNEATGRPETVGFIATQLRDGNVLYIFSVVPQAEAGYYDDAFNRIISSIQLSD